MADFTVKIREQRSVSGTFEAIVEAAAGISIEVDSAGALYCKECGIELNWDHNQRAADEKIVADPEASAEAKRNAQARLDAMKNLAYTTKAGRFTFAYSGFNASGPGHFTAKGFAGVKLADKIPFMQWSPDTGVLTPDAPRASARLVSNEDCPMIGELRIDVMNSASAMITADASAREATATRTAFKDDTPARAHAVANFERTRYDETTFAPIVDQVTLSADWTVYSFDGPEQWSDDGATRWVETANTTLGEPHGVDFRGCSPPLPHGVIPYQGGAFYYHYEHWKTAYAVEKLQKKQVSDRGRERWVDADPAQTRQGREIGPVVTSRNSGSISARENSKGDQGPYILFPGCDEGCKPITIAQSTSPWGGGGGGGGGSGGGGSGGGGGGGSGEGGSSGEGEGGEDPDEPGSGEGGEGEGEGSGEGGGADEPGTGEGGEEDAADLRFPFRGGTRPARPSVIFPETKYKAVDVSAEWLTFTDDTVTCAPRDVAAETEEELKKERTATLTLEYWHATTPEDKGTVTLTVAQDGKFHCVPETVPFPVNSAEPTKVEFKFGTPVAQFAAGEHIGVAIDLDGTVNPWGANPLCYPCRTAAPEPYSITHQFTATDGQVAQLTISFSPPSRNTRTISISPAVLPATGGTVTVTAIVPENEKSQTSYAASLFEHKKSHERDWGREQVILDVPQNTSSAPLRHVIIFRPQTPPIATASGHVCAHEAQTFIVAQDGTETAAEPGLEELLVWAEPADAVPADGAEIRLLAHAIPWYADRDRTEWELDLPAEIEIVEALPESLPSEWTVRVVANAAAEPRKLKVTLYAPPTATGLPALTAETEILQDGTATPAPEDPDEPGEGGEDPDEPGTGGEDPDEPGTGEGGEDPDEPGEGGENPDEPGEGGGGEEEPPPAEGVTLTPSRIVFSALGGAATLTARFPAGAAPAELLLSAELYDAGITAELTAETDTLRTWTLRAPAAAQDRTAALAAFADAVSAGALASAEIVLLEYPRRARTLPTEPFFREKRLHFFTTEPKK